MRKQFLLFLLIISGQMAMAQTPKWAEKARKAIFSVITYDKENKILHTGNGFFVTENGVALSDYALFKEAHRAVIVDAQGKEFSVDAILGASDIYDAVKFKVKTEKKVPALTISNQAPLKGSQAYLLSYATKKENGLLAGKVEELSPIPGGYHYFTLSFPYVEKNVSCPVLNNEGEVFALVQKSSSGDTIQSYAISASYTMQLSFNAISANDITLKSIGIKKALPQKEDQALAYLYLNASGMEPEMYLSLLADFISQFPTSSEGYLRRANYYANNFKESKYFALAEEDIKQALKRSAKKDDVYFNHARMIYDNQISEGKVQYSNWDYQKALTEVQHALAIDSLPLYRQLEGDIYFAMKNYPKALESYREVNRSNLISPTTLYSQAKTMELMDGEPGQIIALLDSAIHLFGTPLPESAAPYVLERAQFKALHEKHREAVADYNLYYETVKANVNDLFYYYREQSHYQARMFKQALEDILKAVKLNPKEATYLAELGAVYLRIARYEEAIKSLNQALAIDPQFASCYRLIGFCRLQLGEKNEACKNFFKAKELGDEAVDSLIEKNCR